MVRETIAKQLDKYFEAVDAMEAMRKRVLLNKDFFSSIIKLVKTKTMDAITDHCKVGTLELTSMTAHANNETVLAAYARHMQNASARKI